MRDIIAIQSIQKSEAKVSTSFIELIIESKSFFESEFDNDNEINSIIDVQSKQ